MRDVEASLMMSRLSEFVVILNLYMQTTLRCLWILLYMTFAIHANADSCPDWLNQNMKRLHSSKNVELCTITSGKPILFVNTASHCGFTPQFKQLEALHKNYLEQGLVVIGVASDSFNQEAKSEADIAEICYRNFGVSFTMLAPTPVKGDNAHPLFKHLGEATKPPAWNFNKYLISADRKTIQHFSSSELPSEDDLASYF